MLLLMMAAPLWAQGGVDEATFVRGEEAAPLTLARGSAPTALHALVGTTLMLRSTSAIRRIYIGNPAVLQSYSSGPQEVALTAKAAGVSSVVIWDTEGRSCQYTVSADVDVSGLRRALVQAYPSSQIDVEAQEGRLAMSGTVPSTEVLEGAAKLAAVYSKDVANSLRIVTVHGKQVELKLRIVEVDRSKIDQLGVNFSQGGRTAVTTSTQQFTNSMNLSLFNAKLNLGVQIQDLEQRQVLQVLAEPTLTTLSGLPGRFLSGGEFPFPVVQGGTANATAITIQFRSYGIKVDFTPTVNSDGTIRLKVAPEVSTLDYTNAVTISGFTIPALSTRRAETEVELQDGQTFMLSGLLDHRTTESLSHLPGIASVPILGQLFRSKNNNHSVVELVVIVTVKVVNPLSGSEAVADPKPVVPHMDATTFDQQFDADPKHDPKP
jgi:pilus assembly protein CpaC